MDTKPFVSYIIPVYQAESFIYNNLKLFSEYCALNGIDNDIIIVNDGSNDKTDVMIRRYCEENDSRNSIKYINIEKNVGKGSAIKKGIEAAKGQFVVFTDCDLPYSFKNIDDVVRILIQRKANVVIANRMHKDSVFHITSGNLSYIYIRHTAGRIYNLLIRLITRLDIEDTQAGLKGFDRETADLAFNKMTVTGFSFDVDILVCAQEYGKKILTIPIEFNYLSEMSTVSFIKHTFLMTFDLMRIFLKRITRYYRR